jgi:hypothetical protein
VWILFLRHLWGKIIKFGSVTCKCHRCWMRTALLGVFNTMSVTTGWLNTFMVLCKRLCAPVANYHRFKERDCCCCWRRCRWNVQRMWREITHRLDILHVMCGTHAEYVQGSMKPCDIFLTDGAKPVFVSCFWTLLFDIQFVNLIWFEPAYT